VWYILFTYVTLCPTSYSVTHLNTYHTYERSIWYLRPSIHIRVIHFIHMYDTMLHMFMGHVMHRISTLILYHLCMFDMTHSCTRHDSFTCESYSQTCSFTDMCNIVSHMWIKCTLSHTHTDSINLIHMCDTMSHLCISHVRDLIEICQTYEWVMAHVRMRARERPRGYARERPTKVKRRGSYIYI